MNEECLRFAEDPEAHAAHLQTCEACRATYAAVDVKPISVEALPLAAWEGASYRPWPLVLGGALAVLAVALALCAAASISPLAALAAGLRFETARAAITAIDEKLRPLGPFVFAALFIAVNSLLILLLRRAPRGIDA